MAFDRREARAMPLYLFVYGTLRSKSRHPMALQVRRRARPIGRGKARGRLYDLGAYPGAIFEARNQWRVVGEVFALPPGDPILQAVDAYEGCGEESEPASGFRRVPVEVVLDGGRRLAALSYALQREPQTARPVPHGDWIAYLAARRPRAIRR
jgi:gamma-glutamylcyclotransferase (GGCT)/AIG2-like uncharacterized protein YtfP